MANAEASMQTIPACGFCGGPCDPWCDPCIQAHNLFLPIAAPVGEGEFTLAVRSRPAPIASPVQSSDSEPLSRNQTPGFLGGPTSPLPPTPPQAKKQRKPATPIGQKSAAGIRRQEQKNASQEAHRAMSKQITALCKANRRHMARDSKVSSKAATHKWAEQYGLTWDGVSDRFELAPDSTELDAAQASNRQFLGFPVYENPYYSGYAKIPLLASIPQFWMPGMDE